MMRSLKYLAGLILIVLILMFTWSKFKHKIPTVSNTQNTSKQIISSSTDSPQIISTIPDPLDNSIVPADQIIQITFNKPLQNAPELKTRIEPKIDYKIELSQDRKTAKIIPAKLYDLGATYTFFISPESKFDGGGSLDGGKVFHFRTVRYTGV